MFSLTTNAAVQHKIDGQALAPLAGPLKPGVTVRVKGVPLVDDRAETLVVEEFSVLAPNAVIKHGDKDGNMRAVDRPSIRQYRGYVEGVPESLVYLSINDKRKVSGLVVVRNRKFMMGSAQRNVRDVFVQEVDASSDFGLGRGFECGTDGSTSTVQPVAGMVPASLAFDAAPNAAPTGTQLTMLNLAVDTDTAMYNNFGHDTDAVEAFTIDLIGAMAVIYRRDLLTDVRLTYLGVRGASDPWAINPHAAGQSSTTALLELGDYWHNTPPTAANNRSVGLLLSGHYSGTPSNYSAGGVAWVDWLCNPEFFCDPNDPIDPWPAPFANHYGGPYAFCGGIGINASDRVVPDPDEDPDYFAQDDGYWALLQIAHEVGHVVQSRHTHCIDTSASPGLQPVDGCFNGESLNGCYSGTPTLPAVGGTIMSYCHFTFNGSDTRYTFGQDGELSEIVIDNMRSRLATKTPSGLSAITAPDSMNINTSNTASVTNTAGLTFDWTITNGIINSGQGTSSINFTATADPVQLQVVATNSGGCGITDFKSVTVNTITFDPPANVVATATSATSVQITWNSVTDATNYDVWRASAAGSYNFVGQVGNVLTYNDTTAVANTSYQYVVRAGDGAANWSTFSEDDVATTVIFTDPTLTVSSTKAKLVH
ncbi:MAG: M12 family metallo-peptidase, partial [Thermoanaerobaculia bacterium]